MILCSDLEIASSGECEDYNRQNMIRLLVGLGQMKDLPQSTSHNLIKGYLYEKNKDRIVAVQPKDLELINDDDSLSIDLNLKNHFSENNLLEHLKLTSGNAELNLSQEDFAALMARIDSNQIVQDCIQNKQVLDHVPKSQPMVIQSTPEYGNKNWRFDYQVCPRGGLLFMNQKLIKEQRRVVLKMIKKIGSNILHGKSIMNISLPVELFDSKSYLQRVGRGFGYAPSILEKASCINNGVEQLKYSMAFAFAQFSMMFLQGTHTPNVHLFTPPFFSHQIASSAAHARLRTARPFHCHSGGSAVARGSGPSLRLLWWKAPSLSVSLSQSVSLSMLVSLSVSMSVCISVCLYI